MISIYAIRNPDTHEIIYIGASNSPEKRYLRHKVAAEWHPVTYRAKQVAILNEQGRFPEMIILEENIKQPEKARERESFWIEFYKGGGHKIEQRTNGGYPTEERAVKPKKDRNYLPICSKLVAEVREFTESRGLVRLSFIEAAIENEMRFIKKIEAYQRTITACKQVYSIDAAKDYR